MTKERRTQMSHLSFELRHSFDIRHWSFVINSLVRVCSKAPRQWSPPAREPRRFETADCNCGKAVPRCSAHRQLSIATMAETSVPQLGSARLQSKSEQAK